MPAIDFEQPRIYGDNTGEQSSVGKQMIPFHYLRKALFDILPDMFFSQMSDPIYMPKHYGKVMKRYHWIPLLDDRNINDQGIDALGNSVTDEVTITIIDPSGASRYAVGKGSDAATALTAAQAKAVDLFKNIGVFDTDYATTKNDLTTAGWTVTENPAVNAGGNLYGSSKAIGTIVGQFPTIGENGGRYNRVGFTRIQLQGEIHNFGFFDEYTEDSVQFDNEPELLMNIARESLRGANRINEDMIQIDLLNAADVIYYGGDATATDELTGESGSIPSILDYETLIRVENTLNNNLCPRDTTLIAGSKMIDTRVIGASRYAYIGTELKLNLLKMTNFQGEAAFIPIQKYASAGTIAKGEIGTIGNFRFIENYKMLHWDGAGATVSNNAGYLESDGKYNVYPVLVVGSESFSTIGFQSGGNSVKFKIIHHKPGDATASLLDPYGKKGFHSIQWWYGTMIWRPEWIALMKLVAQR